MLYAKAGQTTDNEMFSKRHTNTDTSDTGSLDDLLPYNPRCIGYRSLLNLIVFHVVGLGDEVRLKGWQQFRGGFDIKSKFQKLCIQNLTTF